MFKILNSENISLKNIGQNLKHFRKLRRLSQQKVAEYANISLSYYKSIESTNEESPSLETLMKICIVLNVPLDFIVKDCGIELFTDYSNYMLLSKLKDLDKKNREILSELLLSVYNAINNDPPTEE